MDLQQHPRHWAQVTPNKAAIIMGAGQVITYAELSDRADRCAHLMRKLGLNRASHMAMLIENHPRFLEIAHAAQSSGLYFTPISWRFQIDEIAFILEDCGAEVLFVSGLNLHMVPTLRGRLPNLKFVLIDGEAEGCVNYEAELAAAPAGPIADESRGSDMVYSSGSTGRPKGVLQKLPEQGIDRPSPMFQVYEKMYGWTPDTVYMMTAPLYHSGPLRLAMTQQYLGATLVLMEKFDAEKSLALVQQHQVNTAHWVPTMLVRLLKLPDEVKAKYDRSSISTVIHGAGPIAPEAKRAAIEWLGPILEESYGGTEGNGLTMITSKEWLEHPGSVGKAYFGQVHILDDDGNELPPGETGLVYFSGGPKFEYHNNAAKTGEAYDGQGRSTLGDIGHMDAEGYVYLTDRKNDMIVTGAVNVFPQEIENALILHPEVADVAVFGLPDIELGERIQAVVQPRDMARATPELAAELLAYCREKLAGYKTPKSLDFRAELPRHDTGKLYKGQLKAEYLAAAKAPA